MSTIIILNDLIFLSERSLLVGFGAELYFSGGEGNLQAVEVSVVIVELVLFSWFCPDTGFLCLHTRMAML